MIEIDDVTRQAVETVYEKLSGEESIPIKLRQGEGLDEAGLSQVRDAMGILIEQFRSTPYVPKRLAAAFVDIQSSMEWGRDRYSQEEQDKIEDAGIELVTLANELFEDDDSGGK